MSRYETYPEHRKQAMRERSREWRARNPAAVKKTNLRNHLREYGLTVEEFEAMLLAQSGRCAICITPFAEVKEPHVDHDHKTGAVRGLLCKDCNLVLGCVDDSTDLLARAIAYLDGGDLC